MPVASLTPSWIGFRSPREPRPCLWPARRREGLSCPPTGRSWHSDWTSRLLGPSLPSPRGIVASAEDALPAAAAHGTGSSEAGASGWDLRSFNALDPVEVGLAVGLHESAVAHVAGSTASAYVGPWTHFVDWCASRAVPRRPLPASEMTVALREAQSSRSSFKKRGRPRIR
jgi:hypothetical protein